MVYLIGTFCLLQLPIYDKYVQVVYCTVLYLRDNVNLEKFAEFCWRESLQERGPVRAVRLVQRSAHHRLGLHGRRLGLRGRLRSLQPGEGLAEVCVTDGGPVIQPEARILLPEDSLWSFNS